MFYRYLELFIAAGCVDVVVVVMLAVFKARHRQCQ